MQSSLYQRGRAYSWGQWTVELHKRVWEREDRRNRKVETQYARNKGTYTNHAYAIRRADIYSDLRKTQKGKHVNGIIKYRSQKLQHENGNANSTMHTNAWIHCSPFLSPETSQVTRGKFIDRSLHPTLKEKEVASLLDMVPVRKGFQTFLQDWKRFLTAAVWLQLLTFPTDKIELATLCQAWVLQLAMECWS